MICTANSSSSSSHGGGSDRGWLRTGVRLAVVVLASSAWRSLGDEMPCVSAEGECVLPDMSGGGPALTISANRLSGEDSTQDLVTLATCQCVVVSEGAEPLGIEPTVSGTGISTRKSQRVFPPLKDEGRALIIDGNPAGSAATIECFPSSQIACLVQEQRNIDTKDAGLLLYLPFQDMDCDGGPGRMLNTANRAATIRATADLKTLRLVVEQGNVMYDPSQWQAYTATVKNDYSFLGRQGNACIEKVKGMIGNDTTEDEEKDQAEMSSEGTTKSGSDEDDNGGFKWPWENSSAPAAATRAWAGMIAGAFLASNAIMAAI